MKKLLISSMAILTALSLVGCDIESDRDDVEMIVKDNKLLYDYMYSRDE